MPLSFLFLPRRLEQKAGLLRRPSAVAAERGDTGVDSMTVPPFRAISLQHGGQHGLLWRRGLTASAAVG